MAILDLRQELSDQQDGGSFTTGVNASTNVIDTELANSNIGAGSPLRVNVTVGDEAVAGTSSTVQAVLEHSTDNSTYVTLLAGVAIAEATLVVGAVMLRAVVPDNTFRYLRISYTVGTADLSAGHFNADIGIQ